MIDVTRDRILDAATVIIRDSGPEGLTVEAAADLAGVSRKTVYNHFNGKFALIDDAAAAWTGRTLALLQEIAGDGSLSFVPKLNAIVERAYSELKSAGRMIVRSPFAARPDLPGFKAELQSKLQAFIEEIVQDAIDEGIVRPEFTARRLTYAITNVVVGLTVLDSIDDEPFTRLDILKDSLKAFVGGILTPSGAEAMRGSPIFE
ncbi:MAG: TetR/AcrR family transcriptional regulator [Spirochaetes bacterium]|nr:TetR/AcrR family transcriptional regulator [Spirochaetota bacterium]MBU1079806.1 TetR/AcrR family transcriptional regulator [Spirochaetota bacterium]